MKIFTYTALTFRSNGKKIQSAAHYTLMAVACHTSIARFFLNWDIMLLHEFE